ncbi:ATP-binding protein [Mucilaginibacter sp. X4EP1]|uniref:ATP-binding protein n=1 Tax=Mucilaginibacter sp. X4EP1 TaxID=2723092 RepID=UPI00216AA552|nr:ATP-binding protein [Mucilaginibacter sp. X4EP1]MCS3811445.1 hypothetical protein [Mucilaginibacter sp. X4EP1]
MKLSQNDIGGEIISIITKGMYTDPKDALREYVQNGVDADATKIEIKLRTNRIVIQDYGVGMSLGTMRRAVRVGMSDKNPKNSVGFMGIGVYSSFHLCNSLIIFSKIKGHAPNQLIFDFKLMREILEDQKTARIDRDPLETEEVSQVALLPLLEKCVNFNALTDEDFPNIGTRVEMVGIEENFFLSLSKFEEVSEYLEKVVPLPFHPKFSYGPEIQKYIDDECTKRGAQFKTINLNLDINGRAEDLYRPYKDSDFSPSKPNSPIFKVLSSDTEFFGVSWGCLNAANSVIKNETVRGFLLRKQGFALGLRANLLSKFGAKYFNRYVGEIIVTHPQLLPNGARNDFEYSNLRNSFYLELDKVAKAYNSDANVYQEHVKADLELNKLIELYRKNRAELRYFENNSDKLLTVYGELTAAHASYTRRIDRGEGWNLKEEVKNEATKTLDLINELVIEIKGLIEAKKEEKKKKPTTIAEVAKKLNQAPQPKTQDTTTRIPTSLSEVVEMIGYPFSEDINEIFDLIEERYIRPSTTSEEDFINELMSLKNDIEELNNEEF